MLKKIVDSCRNKVKGTKGQLHLSEKQRPKSESNGRGSKVGKMDAG